jgi:SAM-dependent methyltransferase
MAKQLLDRLAILPAAPSFGMDSQAEKELSVLFTPSFLALNIASELYTARVSLLLLMDLGWEARLRAGVTVNGLCEGLPEQARTPLTWMLPFLADQGLLNRVGDRFTLEGTPNLDLKELRAHCAMSSPGHEANFDLLDGVRSHIPPFFLEGKPGDSLLFDLSLFPLWMMYFRNDNMVYRPNNLMAMIALRENLKPGSRVLELGGGAGSFAQLLAQDAAEKGYLDRIAEYRFTDVAPAFLRRAQRELKEKAPGLPLSFGAVDINQDLDAQGLIDGDWDAIVGINVIHVARDLESTLRGLLKKLRPGGRLVLGECMKPDLARPIYLEFFFNFIKSFTDVKLDAELRPAHGFVTPEVWEKALHAAGFHTVRHVPNTRRIMTAFPEFYVGAIAASKA